MTTAKVAEPSPFMLTGYKTLIVNALTMLLAFLAWPQITEIVPSQYVAILITVINIVLRFFTKTPVMQATQATKEQMKHVGP